MKNYMLEWQGPSHMPVLYSNHTLPSHKMATEYASRQLLSAIRAGFRFQRVVLWYKEVSDGEVFVCNVECRLEAKVIHQLDGEPVQVTVHSSK